MRLPWLETALAEKPPLRGAIGIFTFGEHLPRNTWEVALAAAKLLSWTFFLGAIASTWLVNLLQLARLKR